MSINETLQQHVNKLNNMAKELDAIANVVLAQVKVMVLLTSLPNSYYLLITLLKSYKSTKLTWKIITIRLLNKELMRRERGDSHSKSGIVLVHTNQNHVGF
jgi:ferredoxin-fold anticodon binding domain-containing protein